MEARLIGTPFSPDPATKSDLDGEGANAERWNEISPTSRSLSEACVNGENVAALLDRVILAEFERSSLLGF